MSKIAPLLHQLGLRRAVVLTSVRGRILYGEQRRSIHGYEYAVCELGSVRLFADGSSEGLISSWREYDPARDGESTGGDR